MSLGALAPALWFAALVALIVASRGLARPRRPRGSGPGRLPAAIALCARMPSPGAARERARGDLAARLDAAGLAGVTSADHLARARAGGATAGGALAVLALPLGLAPVVAALALAGLGWQWPRVWLGRRIRRRVAQAEAELPDLLDVAAACLEAGMALEPALRLCAERLTGVLALELRRAVREIDFGMPRVGAYRDLANRLPAPALRQMVAALVRAEELGTPLAAALADQAEAIRIGWEQASRERAAAAAPKVQLVVALVMVPGVLVAVIGVMVLELARQVGAVVGGS